MVTRRREGPISGTIFRFPPWAKPLLRLRRPPNLTGRNHRLHDLLVRPGVTISPQALEKYSKFMTRFDKDSKYVCSPKYYKSFQWLLKCSILSGY